MPEAWRTSKASSSQISPKIKINQRLLDMGGGNRVAVPRLSKRFNVGMSSMEPLQEQVRDASLNLNVESYRGKEKSPIARHDLSPQTHYQHQLNLHSTKLLNPRPLCVIPLGKIPEGLFLPVNRCYPGKESSYTQSDVGNGCPELFSRSCLEKPKSIGSSSVAPVSVPIASHTEAASNFQMTLYPVENDEHMEHDIASMNGYSAPNSEGESADMPKNGEEIPAQSLLYLKQISDGDRSDVAEPHSQIICPSREVNPRTIRDKLRKAKISEGIELLKNSVPCSGTSDKDDEESVLDDTIDYIKFLKLQMKLLSQSRLTGESTTYPFVHLEGYGHYLLHQWACNDPLEDVTGNLLEMKPQAANELLESKGLTLLPMDFAYTLLQTT